MLPYPGTYREPRALPFRHIFIAGLGEGRFPRPDPADLLDLRRARRRAGDVTPREQDQYLFLETLLGARVHLELHVTVLGEWQDDPKKLNRLGY